MAAVLNNFISPEGGSTLDDVLSMIACPALPGGSSRADTLAKSSGGGSGRRKNRGQHGGDSEKADLDQVMTYLRAVAYLRLPRSMAAKMVLKGEYLLIATQGPEPDFIRVVAAHLRQNIPLKLSRQGESMQTFIDSLLTDYEFIREFPTALPERYEVADPESELPIRALDLADMRSRIARALESLNKEERALIRSRYWDGLSCRKTAALVDLGKSQVSATVQRILVKIAVAISQHRESMPHRNP